MERTHLRRDEFWTFDIETTTLITGKREDDEPEMNAIIWSGQFFNGYEYIQERSLNDVIKRLEMIAYDNKDRYIPEMIDLFKENDIRKIYFLGSGTSHNACLVMRNIFMDIVTWHKI